MNIINTPFEGEVDNPFPFPLDDFQKHAVRILSTEPQSNILVTAHTGSGKSLVAEYAIITALKKGKKVIYCSPIKTLSNQKYYEFSRKYPSVGIITGDNKHNPMADCLIMTTEILMLMLCKDKLTINNVDYQVNIKEEVFAIIFDEVHYINDVERGNVWEKSIMMVPNNVSIVMLSATINNADGFLEWVYSCNKNPSYLLTNEKRVVPLNFSYIAFHQLQKIPKPLQKYENVLNKFVPIMNTDTKKISDVTDFLALNRYFRDNRANTKWLMNTVCKHLYEQEMCPALFFVFSKKTCFTLAEAITMRFNTDDEGRDIERDVNYYLSRLDNAEDYKKTVQYYQILDLAKKGIAVHHSGLIPVFKEIIEMLFSKNLIKILFATETFAVGLNMPTKTVIFSDVFKFDNGGKRMLHSHEFIQMSGRAGRRGLDTIGYVILLPQLLSDKIDRQEFMGLLNGSPQTLRSKFRIDAKVVLDHHHSDDVSSFVEKTMFNKELESERRAINKKLSDLPVYDIRAMELYEELDNINKQLTDRIQPSKATKKILLARRKEIESLEEYEEIKLYKSSRDHILQCTEEKEYMDTFVDQQIKIRRRFLVDNGYLSNDNQLTQKGQTSQSFKELNNIVGTEIVYNDACCSMDERRWITLLTLITETGGNEFFETPYPDVTRYLESNFDLSLNRKDVHPVLDWYDRKHITEIIKEYSIFEGDLIKTVQRIINYIDEFKEAYVYVNKLDIVTRLGDIQKVLEREIVSTESLYLKL
jgi:superfamily II RNA helicase